MFLENHSSAATCDGLTNGLLKSGTFSWYIPGGNVRQW